MAEGLFDFFSRARGQERRAALEGLLTQFIPPELRPQLGLLAEATPTRAAELAGQSAGRIVQPGLSGWERMAAAGDTLSNMAGVLAPVAAGRAVGMAPVQAVEEALLGASASPQMAAVRDYLVDDFGGVTVWTGGTGDPMKAASDRGAWFSEAQDLAQEYAGQTGQVLRAEIDPRRPISFRHAEQPRTIGDIINTALEGAGQGADFEAARPIVDRLSQRYGVEARPLFEYWNNDKDVADLFRALGYDSISAAEKSNMRAQTWGALDPSIISLSDPAAERGQQIMGLLRSGRGADVTDDMFDMGDPVQNARLNEWLFNNYDLPMDAASRAARATESGFDARTYRGDRRDIRGLTRFDGQAEGGAGVLFSSDEARVANTYAPRMPNPSGENIIPLIVRSGGYREAGYTKPFPVTGSDAEIDAWMDGLDAFDRRMAQPGVKTSMFENQIAAARGAAQPGVVFRQVVDDRIDTGTRLPSDVYATLDPTSIRSRFARFDPRLAHLRNLNAALAGGIPLYGLLSTQPEQEQY